MLNVHFLELFYYVVRAGGVSQAVDKIPYGIQQPAISRQLKQLEQQVGAVLFQRRPFQLTPAGEVLDAATKQFFDLLATVVEQVRGTLPNHLRVGAAPVVLRDYLRSILRILRPAFPGLRVKFKEGLQGEIFKMLAAREIELGVTMIDGELPRECLSEQLLQLPLVLLVEHRSPLRSAEQVWRRRPIAHTLISPEPADAISRAFREGLRRRGLEWEIGMEMSSFESLEAYVADGEGIGVSVTIPGRSHPPTLRALPLRGFPTIPIGMIWRRHPTPVVSALMEALRKEAQHLRQFRTNARARSV